MGDLASLLAAVARRLKLAWGVATGQLLLPFVAATAVLLVGLGFVKPWGWPERSALAQPHGLCRDAGLCTRQPGGPARLAAPGRRRVDPTRPPGRARPEDRDEPGQGVCAGRRPAGVSTGQLQEA